MVLILELGDVGLTVVKLASCHLREACGIADESCEQVGSLVHWVLMGRG